MSAASSLFTEVLYRPLFNLLVGMTAALPGNNIGWAIIGVTFIVRLLLFPSSLHQARHTKQQQEKMQGLQGKLKELRDKHKHDKAKQAEETMRLYREAGVNPAGGCLPLLIQLPILIALYRVFLDGITPESFHLLYGFVAEPSAVNSVFFGVDLHSPSLRLGIIAGLAQFIQMKWLTPQAAQPASTNEDAAQMMASMQRNMTYIFPAMTLFIALQLPAALALYWITTTLFSIGQQYILKRYLHLASMPPAV